MSLEQSPRGKSVFAFFLKLIFFNANFRFNPKKVTLTAPLAVCEMMALLNKSEQNKIQTRQCSLMTTAVVIRTKFPLLWSMSSNAADDVALWTVNRSPCSSPRCCASKIPPDVFTYGKKVIFDCFNNLCSLNLLDPLWKLSELQKTCHYKKNLPCMDAIECLWLRHTDII